MNYQARTEAGLGHEAHKSCLASKAALDDLEFLPSNNLEMK
jgi:hypothetical protein